MTESELLAIVNNAETDARNHNGTYTKINERVLKDYLQRPYGDEVKGKSQVISPDVQDVVESDMASLSRVFLGSSQPMIFEASTDNPREIQEVEEKNKYCNHLIMKQPWSYQVLYSWMKDAEIQKFGVVKYMMEVSEKTEEFTYNNVDAEEIEEIIEDLRGEDVKDVKVVSTEERSDRQLEDGTFNVTFKVKRATQEFIITGVPSDQFIISRNATTIDSAELVGDVTRNKTRGQLLAEGFDRELISKLQRVNVQRTDRSTLKAIRDKETGSESGMQTVNEWASELVEMIDIYVKVDFDGDGIAERRHILKSGNKILVNEAFDHVPYAGFSTVIMPHKAIGRSRGEITMSTQRTKSVIKRQLLDNMYAVNHPRNVVHNDVVMDDYLNIKLNGAVRLKKDSTVQPQQAVTPLIVPPMMDQALGVIQYLDTVRAQSTGTYLASQGLDADAIAKETATRFTGVQKEGDEKIEMVARNLAETGWRKLYEGCAWMVARFQDSKSEIMVLGKSLSIDPTKWRNNHTVTSMVGLGAGNQEKMVGAVQGIYGIQQQLKAQGSVLVDDSDIYHSLSEIVEGLGFSQVNKFFNNPEVPEETLQAENEIMKQRLEQAQQTIESLQNPLAEAENIRAQSGLIKAQGQAGIDIAKLTEDARQFDETLGQKTTEANQKTAVELTKIEAQNKVDVPGALI